MDIYFLPAQVPDHHPLMELQYFPDFGHHSAPAVFHRHFHRHRYFHHHSELHSEGLLLHQFPDYLLPEQKFPLVHLLYCLQSARNYLNFRRSAVPAPAPVPLLFPAPPGLPVSAPVLLYSLLHSDYLCPPLHM